MAHLQKQAAIFSPSVARAAASAAKDWNAVDSWLASRLGRAPPPFERNADTLRVLLALVSANESADEERDVLCRVETEALAEITAAKEARSGDDGDLDSVREDILSLVENSLSREARQALDALASSAVELGLSANVDAVTIGRHLASLQAEIFALSQAADRATFLRRYIRSEAERMGAAVKELRDGESYRPPPDLAKQNLEIQRRTKAAAAALPKTREPDGTSDNILSAEQVREEEEEFLALMTQRNALDAQVRSFQGLPPDTDSARRELESLRDELRQVTRQRDAVFEGLVERETPRKPAR
jgi:HAUS augmin-like complex subunit 1